MDYIDFVLEATRYHNSNKADYRFGQSVFNKLNDIRPDIAGKLVGTELDPYYKTSVTTNVWDFIQTNW